MSVLVLNTSKMKKIRTTPLNNAECLIQCHTHPLALEHLTVTSNHMYREKKAIETWGLCTWTYSLFWPNRKAQKPNYPVTTTPSTTTEEGFSTMFSALCGLFKPFGKEYEGEKKALYMMSWTGSPTKCDCFIQCSLGQEMLHTSLLFVAAGIRDVRVNFTLKA